MCIWIHLSAPENDGQHTWLELWATRIATVLGLVLFINAFIAVWWWTCIAPALLQILASIIIIFIEGPTFVAFLSFAAPLSRALHGKSYWYKVVIYAIITVLPLIIGLSLTCFSIAFILGFFESLGVVGIYLYLALAYRANANNTGVGAGSIPAATAHSQPYPYPNPGSPPPAYS